MASKIGSILTAAAIVGALLNLGTQFAMARPGGGGGGVGHGGSGHVGGGGAHFGGGAAHIGGFGGGHVRGFSGSHFSAARIGHAHSGSAHVRGLSRSRLGASRIGRNANFSGARLGASRTGFAHMNATQAHATGAAGALAGTAAWNRWGNPNLRSGWNGGWGGWNAGWGGWVGPVFWPYFFGNLVAFTFWPYPYFDPFWAYGDFFVWDALFWPGPYYGYGSAYAYGPDYYDIYGGYAYGGPRRAHTARYVAPEVTDSNTNQTDLAQSCGGLAPGVTDLPVDRIEKTMHLTDEQLNALDELKAASSQASDILKTSCSSEVPLTPVDRLDGVQKRINSMTQALEIVRTPLDNFYNSLNDEQRQRFAALNAARAQQMNHRGSAPANDLAALCSRRAEGFTQLPVQRVEQVIKPMQQQQLDAFDKLKAASTEAGNRLQASCPTQTPQTPLDRLNAVEKRLQAMDEGIKTVRPALASFYASLTDEQKARFNTLGPPRISSRQG
jgi:hypothetical protein